MLTHHIHISGRSLVTSADVRSILARRDPADEDIVIPLAPGDDYRLRRLGGTRAVDGAWPIWQMT